MDDEKELSQDDVAWVKLARARGLERDAAWRYLKRSAGIALALVAAYLASSQALDALQDQLATWLERSGASK